MAYARRDFARIRWGMTAVAAAGIIVLALIAASQAPTIDAVQGDTAPAAGPAVSPGATRHSTS
jgi:hypothetical protein